MKFGIGLFSMQTHPEVRATHAELYAHALDLARLAEESGFYSAWISEHHFLADGYCPSALATASAIAAVTTKIRVGSSTLILPLHNPVRVAEDAAVVDNISQGRLDLGVALGYRKEEFEGFGIPFRERPSRMEEGIDVMLRCWEDESFSYNGKRYWFEDINPTPKPVQKPIPIKIGASEEPAVRRAGRMGFPLLIAPGRTIEMVRDELGIYEEAAREAGKDAASAEHIAIRETYVHEDGKKARERAEKYIIDMYRYYFTLGVKITVRGKRIESVDDPLFEYLPEERFIIGDPEECAREVKRLRDELGIGYTLCKMVFPKADFAAIARCVELFGKEVIPRVNT